MSTECRGGTCWTDGSSPDFPRPAATLQTEARALSPAVALNAPQEAEHAHTAPLRRGAARDVKKASGGACGVVSHRCWSVLPPPLAPCSCPVHPGTVWRARYTSTHQYTFPTDVWPASAEEPTEAPLRSSTCAGAIWPQGGGRELPCTKEHVLLTQSKWYLFLHKTHFERPKLLIE